MQNVIELTDEFELSIVDNALYYQDQFLKPLVHPATGEELEMYPFCYDLSKLDSANIYVLESQEQASEEEDAPVIDVQYISFQLVHGKDAILSRNIRLPKQSEYTEVERNRLDMLLNVFHELQAIIKDKVYV